MSTGVLIHQRPLKEDLFLPTLLRQFFLSAFGMVLQLSGFCVVGVGGVGSDAEVGDGHSPWLGQGASARVDRCRVVGASAASGE